MPPKAEKDNYAVLSGNAAIVYLYLLHYPDYAYNIWKTFDGMLPINERLELTKAKKRGGKNKREIKKSKSNVRLALTRYSNVHAILQQLKTAELLKTEEKENEKKKQQKKVIYTVDLEKIIITGHNAEIDPSLYISLVTSIADRKTILEKIQSFEKYDYLTVLLYLRLMFMISYGKLVELYAKTEFKEKYRMPISENFGDGREEQEIQQKIDAVGDMIKQVFPAANNDEETFMKVLGHIIEYNKSYIAGIDSLCIAESAKERGVS